MYGYIYLTTNSLNGKIYVGQKKSKRFLGNKYLGSGRRLKSAIKSYGENVFAVEMIDEAESLDELNDKEIYWISYYNSTDPLIGYNISLGGGVFNGFEVWNKGKTGLQKMSEETRKKMSDSHIGQYRTEETKQKISNSQKGKKRTEEQNQRNRERNIGRKWVNKDGVNTTVSPEQISQFLNDGWSLGRLETENHTAWNKGLHKETDIRVKKYCESHKGHKHSEESKHKIGNSVRGEKNGFYGKKHSIETRKLLSKKHMHKILIINTL